MGLTLAKRPRYANGHAGRDAPLEPLRERKLLDHKLRDRKQGIGLGSCDAIDQKSRGARSQNRKSSLPSASHNN